MHWCVYVCVCMCVCIYIYIYIYIYMCVCVCVCIRIIIILCLWGFCNVWVFWYYVYCTLTEVFLTLTEVFPCFFLSCKANARVKLAKTGHSPHSSTLGVICVVRLLFVLFYALFVCKCVLPPGDNPTAVNKYHIFFFFFFCFRLILCGIFHLRTDYSYVTMWTAWKTWEIHTEFYCDGLKGRDRVGCVSADGNILLTLKSLN